MRKINHADNIPELDLDCHDVVNSVKKKVFDLITSCSLRINVLLGIPVHPLKLDNVEFWTMN